MEQKCNHNCFECVFYDCIEDEMTPQERKAQDRRDMNYSTYGVVIPARRQRKNRGRTT